MSNDPSEVVPPVEIGKPASILIVEDEVLISSYIKEVLGEAGFTVAGIAASGAEALSLAAAQRPGLALVDIRLAGPLDGIQVACALRDRYGVPAIFLTNAIDHASRSRAEAAHPLGFLDKPFLPSQVFNAIERALRPAKG